MVQIKFYLVVVAGFLDLAVLNFWFVPKLFSSSTAIEGELSETHFLPVVVSTNYTKEKEKLEGGVTTQTVLRRLKISERQAPSLAKNSADSLNPERNIPPSSHSSQTLHQKKQSYIEGEEKCKPHSTFILFAVGSYSLSTEAVQRVYEFGRQAIGCHLKITGHTDPTGLELDNDLLAKRRAETVGQIFQNLGFAPDHISIMHYGSRFPVLLKDNQVSRYLSRRVVIKTY